MALKSGSVGSLWNSAMHLDLISLVQSSFSIMQNTQFILALLFKTYTFCIGFFMGLEIIFHFFIEGGIL